MATCNAPVPTLRWTKPTRRWNIRQQRLGDPPFRKPPLLFMAISKASFGMHKDFSPLNRGSEMPNGVIFGQRLGTATLQSSLKLTARLPMKMPARATYNPKVTLLGGLTLDTDAPEWEFLSRMNTSQFFQLYAGMANYQRRGSCSTPPQRT